MPLGLCEVSAGTIDLSGPGARERVGAPRSSSHGRVSYRHAGPMLNEKSGDADATEELNFVPGV
jgi:hypothetical protein